MSTLRIAIALIWVLLSSTNFARADSCLVEEQITKVWLAGIKRAGELATQQKPILDELKQVNNKAKDPTRPVGEQLSPQDVERFSQLNQRMKAIDLLQLLESGYVRDYEVIGNIFKLIQALYTGAKEPQERDSDFKVYQIITSGRYAANTEQFKGIDDVSVPAKAEFDQCTLVAALHLIENESLTKLHQLPLEEATRKLQEFSARYPSEGGTIDRKKMNAQDGAVYDSMLRNTFAPAHHELTFVTDLENLKNIVTAADLKYKAGIKDAIDSAGDASAVGQTFQKMNPDKRTIFGAVILNIIADGFPSEWVQQHEQMPKVIEPLLNQPGARKNAPSSSPSK
jgi:hypothetical protein